MPLTTLIPTTLQAHPIDSELHVICQLLTVEENLLVAVCGMTAAAHSMCKLRRKCIMVKVGEAQKNEKNENRGVIYKFCLIIASLV